MHVWPVARGISLAVVFPATLLLHAQDTRTVKEPVIPPACVTLKATMTTAAATSGQLEAHAYQAGSDKSGLDTDRIQSAIDRCNKGRAVELAPDGAKA